MCVCLAGGHGHTGRQPLRPAAVGSQSTPDLRVPGSAGAGDLERDPAADLRKGGAVEAACTENNKTKFLSSFMVLYVHRNCMVY